MKNLIKIILLISILFAGCNNDKREKSDIKIDTVGLSLNYIERLHTRKTLKDYDKTLIDYIKSKPNRPDSIHKVVYILPFGNMKPEIEEIIKKEIQYLEIFLQLPVKYLDRIPYDTIKDMETIKTRLVPDSDYDYYSKMKGEIESLREQIEASSFIDNYLIPNKPKDAIAILGITEHDIYNPKYNYLFGISRLKNGVGLISTFRLIDYGENTKYNIRKVASKQIVNMFSIKNVKDYDCLLNFHYDIYELMDGEFKLSPRALEKLKYNIGFDYNKRFMELEDFWNIDDNEQFVKYYQECQE